MFSSIHATEDRSLSVTGCAGAGGKAPEVSPQGPGEVVIANPYAAAASVHPAQYAHTVPSPYEAQGYQGGGYQ